MKTVYWVFILCWSMVACNPVTDSQPAPDGDVPVRAIQAVTAQFPQAKGMVFKTLEKSQVWQVTFEQQAARYRAVTNQQMLLVAYQLAANSVPDSLARLVQNTAIAGGTFSNLQVQQYNWFRDINNNGQLFLADYDWRTKRYTLRWNVTNLNGQITYTTELLPRNDLTYRTITLADLPLPIQESLKAQKADLEYAIVDLDAQGQKNYSVHVRYNSNPFILTYGDDGVLVAAVDSQKPQVFAAVSQLPAAIQAYLRDTPELAGFSLGGQFSLVAKSQFGPVQTYTVNLQNGRQTWFMTFDSAGKLISRTYLNLV